MARITVLIRKTKVNLLAAVRSTKSKPRDDDLYCDHNTPTSITNHYFVNEKKQTLLWTSHLTVSFVPRTISVSHHHHFYKLIVTATARIASLLPVVLLLGQHLHFFHLIHVLL